MPAAGNGSPFRRHNPGWAGRLRRLGSNVSHRSVQAAEQGLANLAVERAGDLQGLEEVVLPEAVQHDLADRANGRVARIAGDQGRLAKVVAFVQPADEFRRAIRLPQHLELSGADHVEPFSWF